MSLCIWHPFICSFITPSAVYCAMIGDQWMRSPSTDWTFITVRDLMLAGF